MTNTCCYGHGKLILLRTPTIVPCSQSQRAGEMDGNHPRTIWMGHAGESASQDAKDVLTSTRNSGAAALKIADGGESDFGEVRRERRKNSGHSYRACAGRRCGVYMTNLNLVVLLLITTSFTTNSVVTAEQGGRHPANLNDGGGGNSAGSFERILQEENESNGLFDHFNQTSELNEGEESLGGLGGAELTGGAVDGDDEAANESNKGAPQPALDGDSCKHQLLISLVYDSHPADTSYALYNLGSYGAFTHEGVEGSQSYQPDAVSAKNATNYHAYNQNVCLVDGDYYFSIYGEFLGLVQMYTN